MRQITSDILPKDYIATLPERQANAEKRYKAEQEAFYAELENRGTNTSKETLPPMPKIPLVKLIAGAMRGR